MISGSLMKVKSIAECSPDLHLAIIGIKNQFFGVIFEWPLKTGFTVVLKSILFTARQGYKKS